MLRVPEHVRACSRTGRVWTITAKRKLLEVVEARHLDWQTVLMRRLVGAWLSVLAVAFPVRAQTTQFAPPSFDERKRVPATRVEMAPVIDGDLTDDAWTRAQPISGFVQTEPQQGAAATNDTTVRVLFDERSLYISAQFVQPGHSFNQRDLRRDFETHECDHFSVLLDPLGDGRNAFVFAVNPYGAQRDLQVIDDALFEPNWDTVWRSVTSRTDHGWAVELEIPFKSLRYGPKGASWGVQFFRRERGRNEDTVFSPIPRSVSAARMPYAARLVGLETPPPSLALQFRPYVIGRLSRTAEQAPLLGPSAGGEITWSPTPTSVFDLTINTDFAETDVDRRVVNLGRFNVFFPERRQFFLESSGVFNTGLEGFLQPFFSRRIGLESGSSVPISAGGRFVYRSHERSLGLLAVHTLPTITQGSTFFGVGRYSHHLGAESRVGGMLVARHDFTSPQGEASTNLVPLIDGLFRTGAVTTRASLMGSATITPSSAVGGAAGTLATVLQGTWGNIEGRTFFTTPQFEARTGFVGRSDIVGFSGNAGLDLRPAWKPGWMRNYGPWVDAYAIWQAHTLTFQESNVLLSPWWMQFSGGDEVWVMVEKTEQRLTEAFAPVRRVSFAPGAYSYERFGAQFLSQGSRKFSLSGDASVGGYYSGSRFGSRAKASVQPIPHLQFAFTYSFNRFWGPGVESPFVETHLLLFETRLALTPRLQVVASYQRDTDGNTSLLNARLAWEFLPLSFLYLVVTDTRSAFRGDPQTIPELRVVAKATYTFRP